MRTIKFRVWNGNKMHYLDDEYVSEGIYKSKTKDHKLMQYTGLKDKNGVEIYEYDIVRILYTDWCSQHLSSEKHKAMTLEEYKKDISVTGLVEFFEDRWVLNFGEDKKYWGTDRRSIFEGKYGEKEVIGNIYDNPELII